MRHSLLLLALVVVTGCVSKPKPKPDRAKLMPEDLFTWDAPAAPNTATQEIQREETMDRQQAAAVAEQAYQYGRQAYAAGDFAAAVHHFSQSRAALKMASQASFEGQVARLDEVLDMLHREWAEALEQHAEKMSEAGRYDDAEAALEMAADRNPARRLEIDRQIRALRQQRQRGRQN